MGINQPSSSLKWLKYDPKDYADIFPYAEAFEEIHRKIGQDFSLRKIGEGTWANVFELYKDQKWSYVVKLPRPFYLDNWESQIIKKIQAEIDRQKKFIEHYENLIKSYHKAWLSAISYQQRDELLKTLSPVEKHWASRCHVSYEELIEKKKLLDSIKIPKLLEIYQGSCPIIIMDKIPGKSLWFEIITSVCSPLFEQKLTFWGLGESMLKKSDHTLYNNCIDWDINDKIIAQYLRKIENQLIMRYWKKKTQESLLNVWMIKEDPDLTVDAFIAEIDQVSEPPPMIFTQLYGEKWNNLQKIYDFFLDDFWMSHPDPNLYNFIITPDHKLWIIDFW